MQLQVLVLAEDHKNGFARIGEHALLDEIEHPFAKPGWQIGFKTQTSRGNASACSMMNFARSVMERESIKILPQTSGVGLRRSQPQSCCSVLECRRRLPQSSYLGTLRCTISAAAALPGGKIRAMSPSTDSSINRA
jgi:hypothetical protein